MQRVGPKECVTSNSSSWLSICVVWVNYISKVDKIHDLCAIFHKYRKSSRARENGNREKCRWMDFGFALGR